MRSDELVQAVRDNTTIEDTNTDYTAARIQRELDASLTTTFERMVTAARSGYWAKQYIVAVTTGQPKYRIPPRAVAGGLEKVEIGTGTGNAINWQRLQEVSEEHAALFQSAVDQLGQPRAFVVRGDQVVLLKSPDNSGYSLRMTYYVRPSRLVTQQSSTLGAGTVRGLISAVNTTARTLVVNVVPFDQELAVPAALTSALQRIDIVHPDGWHELALVGATQTLAGTTFTVGGSDDMSEIQVGDFVRVAEQTDWPCLPDDVHRCLADITSVKVLLQQDMKDKATGFAQSVSADMTRFQEILLPRVKAEPRTVRAPLPMLRGRRWW